MSTPAVPDGHENFEPLAVAWAIAALEPAEQEEFEKHCAEGCDRCAGTIAAALEIGLELAYAVPDVEPPPSLRGRLMALAAEEAPARDSELALDPPATDQGIRRKPGGGRSVAGRGGPADSPPGRGRHRTASRRRLASALAVAALVAVSAVTTWQVTGRDLGRTGGTSTSAGADRTAPLSARIGDRTVATVVLTGDRADVVTDSLPPNAGRDTQYVLWGVPSDDGGAPRALGSFQVTSEDLHSYRVLLAASAADYRVLAVSEERAGPLPAAPSGVIARGALNR